MQGVVNENAELVVPCEYPKIDLTEDGHIIVTNQQGVSAILNVSGKVIRPFGKEKLTYEGGDLLIYSAVDN